MLKTRFAMTTALTAVVAACASVAFAADPLVTPEEFPGKFIANVTFTNEYYFRGLSQTDDEPAAQGSIEYNLDIVKDVATAYLGLWGSNLKFNDSVNASTGQSQHGGTLEADWYGGVKGTFGSTGIGWDAGFIYYWYPSADSALNYDYVEAKFALSYDFGILAATASYNYSPDFFAGSGVAHYPKFAIDVPVGKYVNLGAYVAKQYVENNSRFGSPDYTEWNLSAKVNVVGFDVSVAYSDTNIGGDPDGKGAAVLFAVGKTF